MKLKILCFVIAVAAMTTFSVGSASATVLCTTEPTLADGACTGSTYPINTVLSAGLTGGNLMIETASGDVECTKSSMSAKVTVSAGGGSGVPVAGAVSRWLFGGLSEEANNCKVGKTNCTLSDGLNVPYETLIRHKGATKGDGTFEIRESGGAAPSTIVKCGTVIDCIFVASSITYQVAGGAPAIMTGERLMGAEGGGMCPTGKIFLKVKYSLLPKPMYVAEQ